MSKSYDRKGCGTATANTKDRGEGEPIRKEKRNMQMFRVPIRTGKERLPKYEDDFGATSSNICIFGLNHTCCRMQYQSDFRLASFFHELIPRASLSTLLALLSAVAS